MANTRANVFYVSRPTLAGELMAAGIKPLTTRPNPWHRERTTWVFPLTKELAEMVLDYYQAIGERAPDIIQDYFRERGVPHD